MALKMEKDVTGRMKDMIDICSTAGKDDPHAADWLTGGVLLQHIPSSFCDKSSSMSPLFGSLRLMKVSESSQMFIKSICKLQLFCLYILASFINLSFYIERQYVNLFYAFYAEYF